MNPLPRATAIHREADARIVGDGHAIAISRIDPDVVIVAAGTAAAKPSTAATAAAAGPARDSFAPVERDGIRISQEVNLVFVVWGYFKPKVIVRAPAHATVVTDEPPVLSPIVRAPELSAISLLPFIRNAVTSFDHREDSIRI